MPFPYCGPREQKLTGEQIWKVDRAEKSNWATPFIWESGTRTEVAYSGRIEVTPRLSLEPRISVTDAALPRCEDRCA